MKKAEFTPLKQLLTRTVHHYNLDRQVNGSLVCHYFRKISKELWHDAIDEAIQPKSFKEGVLTVAVINSGWAQQVQFKRDGLMKRLAKDCPDIKVKRIRIQIESFSS